MIEARLPGNILQNSTKIFSAPEQISEGQAWGPDDLTAYLQRAGYRPESDDASLGQFTVNGSQVDVRPSKFSYFSGANPLAVRFAGTTIKSIRPLGGGTERGTADTQPGQLTTPMHAA